MGSEPASRPLVSVVVTVKNEARHIRHLLDSLATQEPPFEVIVVDALSHDGTPEIVREFAQADPTRFLLFSRFGSRGTGRNAGVKEANGQFVVFIDGDCFADSQWLSRIRSGLTSSEIVAGRTVLVGRAQYGALERVELFQRGNDVTYPSCNLAYRRSLFLQLGGFDARLITAEDIDLNLRAVESGARIQYVQEAIVYHQMRPTILRFLYQAFWNGYGRKQLTEKHGSLWGNYRIRRLLANQRSVIAWARLVAAFAGYVTRVVTGSHRRLTPAQRSA